ncbi:MAG: PDZ domain-containing protein [Candidatus Omnitrophota bacterium]|jgi:tetratricopeptide (TPR) repeat protein
MDKKNSLVVLLCLGCLLSAPGRGSCDTIYTKEDKEIKGIIVEEYKDRILMSTAEGEKMIMKGDIKELYFDTEEQNLIKLAEQALDRGDYLKAFVYYDKAFKINPDLKAAKDGIVFLQGYLFKKDMSKKEQDVMRRNEFEKRGAGGVLIKTDEERFKEALEKLKKTIGVSLASDGAITRIDSVRLGSPAYEAGMRKGDVLIAVWGRLVGYLSLQQVAERLLEKTSIETACTIERSVDLIGGDIGADFKMQLDGMTVADVNPGSPAQRAGLKQNDIIMEINDRPTRYMPIKKALELIKKEQDNVIILTFRRNITMWGNGGY